MIVGILVNARLGSIRLKRKHLKEINDKPIFFYLLKRISTYFQSEISQGKVKLIICSSQEKENKGLEVFTDSSIGIFYGSKNNIPLRQFQCAEEFSLTHIISVDGDDILCSVEGMAKIIEGFEEGEIYLSTSGLPFGMNSFGYSTSFLRNSLKNQHESTLETGWGRIFDSSKLKQIPYSYDFEEKELRFTLDYDDDFEFFKKTILSLADDIYTVNDQTIIELVQQTHLYEINKWLSDEYWRNYYKNMENEKNKN